MNTVTNIRIPRAVCAVVGDVLPSTGSHPTLDSLFKASGAPGEPPDLSHAGKWKDWLFRAGNDPNVESLAVLWNILEEFMDLWYKILSDNMPGLASCTTKRLSPKAPVTR